MKNSEKNRLLEEAMERKIGTDGHRLFYEVESGKGTRADAVAIPPPDSELGIRAYEFKVDRSDFKHELKNPSKRAPWRELASAFTFVTFEGVASEDEIPEGCGFFTVDEGGQFHRHVEPEREPTQSIEPKLARQIIRKARNVTLQNTREENRGIPVDDLAEYDGDELTEGDLTDIVQGLNDHMRSAPGLSKQVRNVIFEAFGSKDELSDRIANLKDRNYSSARSEPLKKLTKALLDALSDDPAPGFHSESDVADLQERLQALIDDVEELSLEGRAEDGPDDTGEESPDDFLSPDPD